MKEYDVVRPYLLKVPELRPKVDNYDRVRAALQGDPGPQDRRGRAEEELATERRIAVTEGREPTLTRSHVNRAIVAERDKAAQRSAVIEALGDMERALDDAVWSASSPMAHLVADEFVRAGWTSPPPRHLELLWTMFAWPQIGERPGEVVHSLTPNPDGSNRFRTDEPEDRRGWWPIPVGAQTPYARTDLMPVKQSWWAHALTQIARPKGKGVTFDADGTMWLRERWQAPGVQPVGHGQGTGWLKPGTLVWVGGPHGVTAEDIGGLRGVRVF